MKHDTLLTDLSYIGICNRHATVVRLGKNCTVFERKVQSLMSSKYLAVGTSNCSLKNSYHKQTEKLFE